MNESKYSILNSTAVSIFVVVLVELTNTVFVNSTNITTNIETVVLSKKMLQEMWDNHTDMKKAGKCLRKCYMLLLVPTIKDTSGLVSTINQILSLNDLLLLMKKKNYYDYCI